MTNAAIDTNVLIYLHDSELISLKRDIANQLISDVPLISPQVVSEYLNVCHKRLKMAKEDAMDALMVWLPYCKLANYKIADYSFAMNLIPKYKFQMFDAIIVASALDAGCTILYSEDMQHNLLVEKQLKIVNPFI